MSRILYRDGLVLVLDKPAGLPVHPGPGGGETLTRHLDALRFGLKWRPELAHRLDRDTSGCLVLGRHPKALRKLADLFATGRVEKTYLALVSPAPAADRREIELAMGPAAPDTPWRMKIDPDGQPALTRLQVLARAADGERALVALEPVTGRTHQLRVHCAASGFPIVGDAIYGGVPRGAPLHLHSWRVGLPLSRAKPPIRVEAPLPEPLRGAAAALGFDVNGWKDSADETFS
ncbi:RNA pseudouridine synthase [Salinarimonas ramus]|uniref:RNA pseudouridine synthase n=1 Tax=Salinarimonas ramus TaxID=690164 RepID=A0A917Q8M4_9HYPH|nr:RNA pseudouridine synthase [Salinarimonas ramus]